MKMFLGISMFFSLLLVSCSDGPSLQKYFVENTEIANFISLDKYVEVSKL